jgi:dTDP-4-dehydrorhamnose reductase
MKPKILLIGKKGQVGWELNRYLPRLGEVIALDHHQLDLARLESIRTVVRERQPGLIVNAAAYTGVDQAETEVATAQIVNGEAPGVIAEAFAVKRRTDSYTHPACFIEVLPTECRRGA